MNFWGADTAQLRQHGSALRSGGQQLDELISTLTTAVNGTEWVGADAEEFRHAFRTLCSTRITPAGDVLASLAKECEEHAEGQDDASESEGGSSGGTGGGGSGGGVPQNPLDILIRALRDYEPLESDGFWGDLLGGPEAGYWGNLAWNSVGILADLAGLIPEPTGVGAAISLANDIPSAAIGYYDALQSFQDGDYFGTADGLITGGINTLDIGFGVLSLVPPIPPVGLALTAIGEVGGVVTGSLDMGWSALSAAAQVSAITGGPGGGSTTRFLATAPAWALEEITGIPAYTDFAAPITDGIDDVYSQATTAVRDAVPIIDPLIDVSQRPLEWASTQWPVSLAEDGATAVNDWIRDRVPW
ncbi:hypothetical protein GCM10023160_18330 [Brachybacterium paraconglomeratum]|uniref:hypothetical protein n=1 Tax=Brachybacterium paraconglomeratum TaxID=173362 RepID=UPI0031E8E9F9